MRHVAAAVLFNFSRPCSPGGGRVRLRFYRELVVSHRPMWSLIHHVKTRVGPIDSKIRACTIAAISVDGLNIAQLSLLNQRGCYPTALFDLFIKRLSRRYTAVTTPGVARKWRARRGYRAKVDDGVSIVLLVRTDAITPRSKAFRAAIWHPLVTHPHLVSRQTK
jgi:hypothetical protein